jgi:hypothetical protein
MIQGGTMKGSKVSVKKGNGGNNTNTPASPTCSSIMCSPHAEGFGFTLPQPATPPNPATDDREMPYQGPCTTNLCDLEYILALSDFLVASQFTVLTIIAAVAIFTSGAPAWAIAIGITAFVVVGFVALNVSLAGGQVLLSYIYPELDIDVDPLPLVPDEWHRRD